VFCDVGDTVIVNVGVAVCVNVGVGETVTVKVGVEVTVSVNVSVAVNVGVGVTVRVTVGVAVNVLVGFRHAIAGALKVTALETTADVIELNPDALPLNATPGEAAVTSYTHVKSAPAAGARLPIAADGALYKARAAGTFIVKAEAVMLSIAIVPLLNTVMIIVTCWPTTALAGAIMLEIMEPPGMFVGVCVTVYVGVPVMVLVDVNVAD
jgi:hypothetical protein